MEVEFANRRLQERFERYLEAARAWGEPVARKYVQRVREVQAASSVAELQALRSLRLHPLKGGRTGEWSIDLHGRWRMIVKFEGQEVRIEEVSNHYDD